MKNTKARMMLKTMQTCACGAALAWVVSLATNEAATLHLSDGAARAAGSWMDFQNPVGANTRRCFCI